MADDVRDRLLYMQTLRVQIDTLRTTYGAFDAFHAHLLDAVGDSVRETMITAALGHTKAEIGTLLTTITTFLDDLAGDYPGLFDPDGAGE
jgi:hypothetical protein